MTTIQYVVPVDKLLQVLLEHAAKNLNEIVLTKLQLPEGTRLTGKIELDDYWENATVEIEL